MVLLALDQRCRHRQQLSTRELRRRMTQNSVKACRMAYIKHLNAHPAVLQEVHYAAAELHAHQPGKRHWTATFPYLALRVCSAMDPSACRACTSACIAHDAVSLASIAQLLVSLWLAFCCNGEAEQCHLGVSALAD